MRYLLSWRFTGHAILWLHLAAFASMMIIYPSEHVWNRYEGQRDMLYNQTFNLDQVAFAAEGIKDAQQTVSLA